MDVEAVVKKVEQTIESCSQQDVELHIERVGLSSALSDHTTDKQTDIHGTRREDSRESEELLVQRYQSTTSFDCFLFFELWYFPFRLAVEPGKYCEFRVTF